MKLTFPLLTFAASLLSNAFTAPAEIVSFDLHSAKTEMELSTAQFKPPAEKSAVLAATLSTLVPGLGHVYLDDMQTAGSLMGSAYLGIGLSFSPHLSESTRTFSLLTAQNIIFYGAYAAYRDARLYNGSSGYKYKMPTDSLASLSYAPFKASIVKKAEVWGGLIGALALASYMTHLFYPKNACIKSSLSSKGTFMPIMALPVGIGEESFFRGYLQPALSEPLTPLGGIVLSSLAFGAIHIPNAQALPAEHRWRYYCCSLPLITAIGCYCGWLTYKNNSLQESVALHTWYDLVIFTATAAASEAAISGGSNFAISLPF